MPPHLASVLGLCALLLISTAAAQSCPVKYSQSGRPLLFGGVNDPGRCLAGCQRVNSYWTEACKHRVGETWGSCTKEQVANNLSE